MQWEHGTRSVVQTHEKVAADHANFLDGQDDVPLPVSSLACGQRRLAFVTTGEAAVAVVGVGTDGMHGRTPDGSGLLSLKGHTE